MGRSSSLLLRKYAKNEEGQTTVEYALVAAVLLSIVIALGFLFSQVRSGLFIEHATASASHVISGKNAIGLFGDVLLY